MFHEGNITYISFINFITFLFKQLNKKMDVDLSDVPIEIHGSELVPLAGPSHEMEGYFEGFDYDIGSDKESEDSDPDEDSGNELSNNFRNIALRGKIWTKYRPIKQDSSLYSRILNKTEDISSIVQELCALLIPTDDPTDDNSRKAAASLLQFCTDVCGYQRFDIIDLYMRERNVKTTLSKFCEVLDTDAEYVEAICTTTVRYLLMENSRLAKSLQYRIYTFLQDFTEMAHTNGLLDQEGPIKDFFEFVISMTCNMFRVFCHTGAVFCVKIITALIVKIQNMTGNHQNTFKLVERFYSAFIKNIKFDRKLDNARVEFCREICIWVKIMPQKFIGDWNILCDIKNLIIDPAKKVRLMFLIRVVRKFLKNRETFQLLRRNLKHQLIELVSQRFGDVDEEVAVEAVRIFTILLEITGETYLNVPLVANIIETIFENRFVIAQAACDFVNKYFIKLEKGAAGNVLNLMTKLAQMTSSNYGPQLLVEGCLQVVPEIKDWALYIRVLSEKREDFSLQNIATVFAEAVSQVLKGCSSKLRNGSPTIDADPAEHNRIAQHFPQLIYLISEFRDAPSIQEEIFKIFTIVKSTTYHTEDYMSLCDLIEQLFTEDLSKQLLKQIVFTLDNLCDDAHFGDHAKVVERSVVDNCSEEFQVFLKESVGIESSPIVNKAMVLYENGKFTNKIPWSLLFHSLPNFEQDVLTDLLICCKWHLIWTLKELIKETTTDRSGIYQKDNPNLLNEIKSYTTLLFQVLTDLEVHTLRVKVYICTCEFYKCWNDIVISVVSSNKSFEKLILSREPKITDTLIPFLEENIIKNKEMPLKERQKGIVAFINMVNYGATPLSNLKHVYKYYNQYSSEYGKIIETSMKYVADDDTKNCDLNILIIGTIANVHDAIIDKYGAIDMKTSEAKALKALTKRFLITKPYRNPNNNGILLMVTRAMNYSVNHSKMSYLFFAQYFLTLITNPSDFDYILDMLRRHFNEEQKKSDAVLCFIENIKRLKDSKTSSVIKDSAKVQGNKHQLSDSAFASPGKPILESTPIAPESSKKKKTERASISSGTVPQGTTPKGKRKDKKTARKFRPVYSKSSESAINIQDDSN